MERQDVTSRNLMEKEWEITDFEDDYRKKQLELEEKYQSLYDRYRFVSRLVDEETDKVQYLLKQCLVSDDEVRDYYWEVENLLYESDASYRRQLNEVEWEMDESEQEFRRERNRLEDEFDQLRREYYDARMDE